MPNGDRLYTFDIASRVPFMLRTICYIWIGLAGVGILLMKRNRKAVEEQEASKLLT